MELLPGILGVTFPFFGLVLCGHAATRSGLLPAQGIPGLNVLVLYFALPCMPSVSAPTPAASRASCW